MTPSGARSLRELTAVETEGVVMGYVVMELIRTTQGLLALIILCVVLAGCSGASPSQPASETRDSATPIQLTVEGSKPLTFYRLLFETPAARKMIDYDAAVLKDTHFPYAASVEFDVLTHAELRRFGYTVLGTESVVFSHNDWESARYQLGGTVTQVELASSEDGGHTRLVITWQFYDAVEKEVLFTTMTSGSHQGKPVAPPAPVFEAFKSALRALLANPDFVTHMAPASLSSTIANTAAEMKPLSVTCEAPRSLTLPHDLEAVAGSIVTIQGGDAHGSGVIVSSDGYVLTAEHVVAGAKQVEAHLHSGLRLPARVIRIDKRQDVGLLKLPGAGYACLTMRLTAPAAIGAQMYVIGTPWRKTLAFSISQGVLSGQRVWNGAEYIQTDASVNPGNSGGPLLDEAGQIVGIVSRKAGGAKFEGLSFGVPMIVAAERLGLRSGSGESVSQRPHVSSERVAQGD